MVRTPCKTREPPSDNPEEWIQAKVISYSQTARSLHKDKDGRERENSVSRQSILFIVRSFLDLLGHGHMLTWCLWVNGTCWRILYYFYLLGGHPLCGGTRMNKSQWRAPNQEGKQG